MEISKHLAGTTKKHTSCPPILKLPLNLCPCFYNSHLTKSSQITIGCCSSTLSPKLKALNPSISLRSSWTWILKLDAQSFLLHNFSKDWFLYKSCHFLFHLTLWFHKDTPTNICTIINHHAIAKTGTAIVLSFDWTSVNIKPFSWSLASLCLLVIFCFAFPIEQSAHTHQGTENPNFIALLCCGTVIYAFHHCPMNYI